MPKIKIMFVVAGNTDIGMGRIHRSLCIAEDLKGHDIEFICLAGSAAAEKYLSQYNHKIIPQKNSEKLAQLVIQQAPNLVINDFPDTCSHYIRSLKAHGIKIVNFEDKGGGARYADSVINVMLRQKKKKIFTNHSYFDHSLLNSFSVFYSTSTPVTPYSTQSA